MSDSRKKFEELEDDLYWKSDSTTNVKTIYPGDILIHESPNGGKTVKSRPFKQPPKKDIYVELVKSKFEERSQRGIKKYNTTLEREDLNLVDWLNHAQEEAMDFTLYLERIMAEIKEKGLDKLYVEK